MRNDDNVALAGCLLDRVPNQAPDGIRRDSLNVRAGQASKAVAVRARGPAELPDYAAQRRLALLLIGDIARRDPSPRGRAGDDRLVYVVEPKSLGCEAPDRGASRPVGPRYADDGAGHAKHATPAGGEASRSL